jgi:hypothetical protein
VRKRVRAARGYGGPREWVLTAALAGAARGPGTRRREIEGREGDHREKSSLLVHNRLCSPHHRYRPTVHNTRAPLLHTMWEQSNPHRAEDRTATLPLG